MIFNVMSIPCSLTNVIYPRFGKPAAHHQCHGVTSASTFCHSWGANGNYTQAACLCISPCSFDEEQSLVLWLGLQKSRENRRKWGIVSISTCAISPLHRHRGWQGWDTQTPTPSISSLPKNPGGVHHQERVKYKSQGRGGSSDTGQSSLMTPHSDAEATGLRPEH